MPNIKPEIVCANAHLTSLILMAFPSKTTAEELERLIAHPLCFAATATRVPIKLFVSKPFLPTEVGSRSSTSTRNDFESGQTCLAARIPDQSHVRFPDREGASVVSMRITPRGTILLLWIMPRSPLLSEACYG